MVERTLITVKVIYFRKDEEPHEVVSHSWFTIEELSHMLAVELMDECPRDDTLTRFTVEEVSN